MADINSFDNKMKEYFNALPKYIQENIVQSNSDINNYNDLVSCSENIMSKK